MKLFWLLQHRFWDSGKSVQDGPEYAVRQQLVGDGILSVKKEKSYMDSYSVVVQAGPDEISGVADPMDLCIQDLLDWPSIDGVVVALPDLEGVAAAKERLDSWGVNSFVGDPYNVCKRVIGAYSAISDQSFTVRVLAIWKHVDLGYVDQLVAEMKANEFELVSPPANYDLTMAADIASLGALENIANLEGNSQDVMRARFNPWGYMEMHPELFRVKHLEPAPMYSAEKIKRILSAHRAHPENEFFGRDYAGSRYHFIVAHRPIRGRVLDIACGSGFGSKLISEKADFVLGVDYLDSYIELAKERYPETDSLKFMQGNGESFLYEGKEEQFDTVVSLHTLEHVHDDKAMIGTLFRNLKKGGLLVVEVPKRFEKPLGVPINPYHIREYSPEEFIDLVEGAGFEIQEFLGSSRSFYGRPDQARDAMQAWATKPA